jgi:hypothetical protein
VHAAEDDDVGFRLSCFATQSEGITDKVRYVLDLRALVIVRENYAFFFFASSLMRD